MHSRLAFFSGFPVVALGLSILSGCMSPTESEEVLPPLRSLQTLTAENGANLNGANLNGANLNGNDLSQFLVSVNYQPVKREGAVLDQVWLSATRFTGTKGSRFYSGEEFIGAEFVGNLGGGTTVQLRIAGISPAPAPNADLLLYDLRYLGNDGQWRPACYDHSGTPVQAMPIEGVWDYRRDVPGGGSKLNDPDHFTFACMGGAIAKCTLWGYRPWASYNGTLLEPYHQTCTRLVRADYCGTGTSYTQTGNRINLFDELGIQQDTEDWVFEAEWDEHGARCFYPLNRSHAALPCYDSRADLLCGQQASSTRGVRLRNETPSDGILP